MLKEILIYSLSAVLFLLLVFYYMNMYQQNSYRIDRFWRWFRGDPMPHLFRKAKVKFVFTPRMRRLLCVEVILFALLCLLSPWAALAGAVLCPFVMMVAAGLASPMEKAVSRWYYNDAAKKLAEHKGLIVIGVTGSFGKTSTKNYLYRVLSEKYNVLMTPGNFNTTMGVVRTIRERLEPYHQVFIVEMGAKQVGDIKQICDLVHPSVGIVTAVGEMHLETFGSLENVRKTKFELLDSLPTDGYGVMNAESAGIASYKGGAFNCRVDSYGIDAHRCDARAANISYTASGMEFDFISASGSEHYKTHLLGENNVLNLCAALMVGEYLGVDARHRQQAVFKIQSVEHRLSLSRKGGLTILDDAYNSNPEGAAMALDVLGRMEIPEGARRIVITPGFVEMGSAQERECRKLGERAAKCADVLVIVNKVNRKAILSGALEAGMDEERIICADTLAQGLAEVRPYMSVGSVVLYENDLPDMFK